MCEKTGKKGCTRGTLAAVTYLHAGFQSICRVYGVCTRDGIWVKDGDGRVMWVRKGPWACTIDICRLGKAYMVREDVWGCTRGAMQFEKGIWNSSSQEGWWGIHKKCSVSWEKHVGSGAGQGGTTGSRKAYKG